MSSEPNSGGEAQPAPRMSLFGRRARDKAATPPVPAKPPAPPAEPPRRPRRAGLSSLSALLSFVLIGAVIGVGAFAWVMSVAVKPGPLAADKVVVITNEADGGLIGDQLERAGVIDSSLWFTVVSWLDGHKRLNIGEYDFKARVSVRQVQAQLISGKVVQHALTIPEGLTSEQVVQRVREADFLSGDVKELPREGSILPETYDFPRNFSRQNALLRMQKQQAKLVDDIWKKRAPDLPIKSPGELVTLASIVEKETGKADERPRVAGVFVNRLQKHMRLQSDPTIVYGLVYGKGTLGHPITKPELDQATPYNTYIIEGLPPGPIANPGKAAMEAVANPLRTKELYFVADGTGGHAFAETLDQHQKNVAKWRQIEKDAKDRLAPDVNPAPPAQTRGALDPADPARYGALAAPAPAAEALGAMTQRLARLGADRQAQERPMGAGGPLERGAAARYGALAAPAPAAEAPGAMTQRLAKLGADRQMQERLVGANGPLSAASIAGKTLEELGAVVTGVNDSLEPEVAADAGGNDGGPVASYPMSAAMLADQKAREVKYGAGAPSAGAAVAFAAPDPAPARGVALDAIKKHWVADASEGTALDPLKNKTFDLNYAKVVPPLK